jgi:hypothetical protein
MRDVRAILLAMACAFGACAFHIDALVPGSGGTGGNGSDGPADLAGVDGDVPDATMLPGGGDLAHAGAFITVEGAPTPGAVDLTFLGPSDWAHWGFSSAGDFDHKATGNTQIGNFSSVGVNVPTQYASNPTPYFWSDGLNGNGHHPKAMGSGTATGVYVLGGGFKIAAPADTTVRRLRFYVGALNATGQIDVSLSDNSAPAYGDHQFSDGGGGNGSDWVYTITYAASSPGQTLSVQWTGYSFGIGGNVTLQSAALQIP